MSGIHSQITCELRNLGLACLLGAVMTAFYDVFRILRRIIRHGIFWISAEDCLYWLCFAVAEFGLLYQQNNGVIRFYIFLGTVVGAVLYHFLISRPIMAFFSRIIIKMKKNLKKLWKSVMMWVAHDSRK